MALTLLYTIFHTIGHNTLVMMSFALGMDFSMFPP